VATKAKRSYKQRLEEFADGKRFKWVGWSDRGSEKVIYSDLTVTPAFSCQACGSKVPKTFAVLQDLVTGRLYLVGYECYRRLHAES
jgi:hypothetical protein